MDIAFFPFLKCMQRDIAARSRQELPYFFIRTFLLAALLGLILPHWYTAGAQQAQTAGPAATDSSSSAESNADSNLAALPDDPQAQTPTPSAPEDKPAPQTKRILGIIPNFRAISTDQKLPPQTAKEKFLDATEDSFDYSAIFVPLVLAGYSLETNATPEFGHGGVGYGRYLWHTAVDQTSENYMVEFFVPVLTHEDTRYYTLGRGGFMKRAGYALSRAVVTRTDSGKAQFNFSEVFGAGAAAGLSNLYYPSAERSFGNTGKEWGINVGVDAIAFVAKEFWPDINHKLFHGTNQAGTSQAGTSQAGTNQAGTSQAAAAQK